MSRRSTKARRAATRRRRDYALVAGEMPLPPGVRLYWNPAFRCWTRVGRVRVLPGTFKCRWLTVRPGGETVGSNIEWIS